MIGIVGAGMTGLALSRALARYGVEHVVLEAASEPGGVVRSVPQDGRVLELGPQRTRLTRPVAAVVGELGLEDEVVTAPPDLPLYVYHDGALRRVPFSLGAAIRTDLLSWRGKARVLLEPFTGPEREDETVAGFLTRKLGREVYERMIGPLYGGLYASDPATMYMRHSLSRAMEHLGVSGSIFGAFVKRAWRRRPPPPACSFRDGMQTLPRALYRAQQEHVYLNTPVRALRRRDGGFVLETPNRAFEVDRVVLTTPAGAAAELLRAVAPDAADRLERLTYNPLAVVHLYADCPLRGLGYQVSFAENLATRGVTWNASMFGRDGVYTAYLGGAKRPEVVDEPDDRIGERAVREFRQVTGCDAEVLRVSRIRMPAWDRSWTALDGLSLPRDVHLCSNYESRAGIPGRLARAQALAGHLAAATAP